MVGFFYLLFVLTERKEWTVGVCTFGNMVDGRRAVISFVNFFSRRWFGCGLTLVKENFLCESSTTRSRVVTNWRIG